MRPTRLDGLASRRSAAVWCAGIALAATLGAPASTVGQLTGTTVDQSGSPLPGVLIEAWSADRRVQTRISDEQGRFLFAVPVAEITTALYAHRLGLQALRVEVDAGVQDYLLRMMESPIALEGLVVDVGKPVCSGSEDEEARKIWTEMAARYSDGVDTLGIATYVASSIEAVAPSEIGPVAVGSVGSAQRGSAPLFRASWSRRVDRSGYARSLSAPSSDGTFEAWGYPPLEADFAVHFGQEVFGKQHRFTIDAERNDGWYIRFCPRDDDDPNISGILHISTDTLLKVAEWTFSTEEPNEDAGGRAVFSEERPAVGAPYLLPAEGLFWRRTGHDQFLQRYERYEGWIVAPGDSVPFLPSRGLPDPVQADTTRSSLARPALHP